MADPTSSTAAGIAGWKLAGGAAGIAAGGAGLAAIVVMCMTPPRSAREWPVAIISTVLGSVCGGAGLVQYLGLHNWTQDYMGLVALMGVAFACGLPALAPARWRSGRSRPCRRRLQPGPTCTSTAPPGC